MTLNVHCEPENCWLVAHSVFVFKKIVWTILQMYLMNVTILFLS